MKGIIIFLLCFVYCNIHAQKTIGSVKWRGYTDADLDYSGELNNGLPDGKGVAVSEGGVLKFFGDFKNGKFEGNGVMLMDDGSIIIGPWKDNLPYGKYVGLTKDKSLHYGPSYYNNEQGHFIIITGREVNIGEKKDGLFDGRVIHITGNWNQIFDNIYTKGSNKGPGYGFSLGIEGVFTGYLDDYFLRREEPVTYPSFMKDGMKSIRISENRWWLLSNHVFDNGKELAQDTCLYASIRNGNMQFGYFDHGDFKDGVQIENDSITTIGHFTDKGDEGLCVVYKKDFFLLYGNFHNGAVNGHAVVINIRDSIVYDGEFINNAFTGKGVSLAANNDIQLGIFNNDKLNGEGKIIHADGKYESGIFYDGILNGQPKKEIITKTLPVVYAKAICTAVNFLVKEFENNFNSIKSNEAVIINPELSLADYTDALTALYVFPGASYSRILPGRDGLNDPKQNFYTSCLLFTKDYTAIKKKYGDICRQIAACSITSLTKGKAIKLISKIRPLIPNPEDGSLASLFTVPVHDGKKNTAIVRVMVERNYDDSYQLTVDVIAK